MISQNETNDYRWWTSDRPDQQVWSLYEYLRTLDATRRRANWVNMRLYGNLDLYGVTMPTLTPRVNSRLTVNIIKSVCDTANSKIAKVRPKPVFLTSGGNYSLRKRAKNLEKYVDMQMYLADVYPTCQFAFLDACVFGTGCVKVYRKNKQICIERVYPGEILVDPVEGLYGKPQSIMQRKYVNRDKLIALFPKKKQEILRAPKPSLTEEDLGYNTTADQVEVVESWHLPSMYDEDKGKTDGRHVICVQGATLFQEEWKHDYFPFVFLNWGNRLRGFWGIGLSEQLTGIQVEINTLLQKIQRSFQLLGVPWVMVENGSKIKKAHINNEIGAVIPYTGTPPIVRPNTTVAPEIFAHLNWLVNRAYEEAGVNQFTASGAKPQGLTARVAIAAADDIQTERFALVSQRYEEMFMGIAERIVDLGKEIAEEYPGYTVVMSSDKYTIQQVKWSEVDLDRDSYVLKVFPASSLPSLPAFRQEKVIELMQAGLIDAAQARRLLDFPDLDAEMALDRAASDNADRIVENILDEGIYEAPEPFQDLQLTLKRAQAWYNKAVGENVPEDRLAMLRQLMTATRELQKLAEMEAMNASGIPLPGAPPPFGPNGAPPMAVTPMDGSL